KAPKTPKREGQPGSHPALTRGLCFPRMRPAFGVAKAERPPRRAAPCVRPTRRRSAVICVTSLDPSEEKGVRRMKLFRNRHTAVAIALCLIAAGQARADQVAWDYNWTPSQSTIPSDQGASSYIKLS